MQISRTKFIPDDTSHKAELYSYLYSRHLEDASFLYYLRPKRLNNPNIPWTTMMDEEKRFLSLINGLVHGQTMALKYCLDHRDATKPDKIHVIVRLLCRRDDPDEARRFINSIDLKEESRAMAIADALKWDMPESWMDTCIHPLLDENPLFLPVAAETAGYRRIDCAEKLIHSATKTTMDTWATRRLIHALSRISYDAARLFLLGHLESNRPEILYETCLALLRVRTEQRKAYLKCKDELRNNQWPCLILSLCADETDVQTLQEHLQPDIENCQCTLALGFMGHAGSVRKLLPLLESKTARENAAQALHLITGAGLAGKETNADRQSSPGKLSMEPDAWHTWWKTNQHRFDTAVRYRNGRPYSPDQLIEALLQKESPSFVRAMAYEELVVRFGLVVPFETDMFMTEQSNAIHQYSTWLSANPGRWPSGDWLMGGKRFALYKEY